MTPERWYVCADVAHQELIARGIRAGHDMATILPARDPWQVRRRLLTEMPGSSSVAVGTGCGGIEPVNLAAALACDGHASEVVLFVPSPSGSLLSRAACAGIDGVVDELGLAPVADAPVPSKPMERDASARRIATGDGLGAGPRHAGMEWEERVTAPFPAGSVRLEDGAGEIEELDRDAHVPPSRPVGGPGASEPPQAPVPERPVPTPRADSSVPAHACPIVTLASGRGGVGKTTLSVVAACVASSWGLRVGLVDLDLSFGNAFSFMGLAGPGDLAEFAQSSGDERERAIRSARKAADGLTLWGPCARPELAEVVVPQVGALLSRVSKEVDLVIVDTSSDWGDEVAVACQMADRLVLVADERAGAVASLSRAGALAVRLGVARTRIERVMNRCDRKRRDEGFLARADMGLEVARAHRVVDGGIDVSELLSAGQASELVAMDDGFSASVASWIASTLSELGALPDVPEARKAAERTGRQARRMPFGLGRKAS